jgi:hypothetical protein
VAAANCKLPIESDQLAASDAA